MLCEDDESVIHRSNHYRGYGIGQMYLFIDWPGEATTTMCLNIKLIIREVWDTQHTAEARAGWCYSVSWAKLITLWVSI